MAPSILDAAKSVQKAVNAPQGSLHHGALLPGIGSSLPSWSQFETQAYDRTTPDPLLWPQSCDTYEQMRRDPQVQGLLASAWLPIRHMEWYVDPADSAGNLAEEIAEDLGLPLLGQAQQDDGVGLDWDEHLRTALLAMAIGHRFFEETGEIRAGRYRLTGLLDRPPTTIESINHDNAGLVSIQVPPSEEYLQANPAATFAEIPAQHLLSYVWDREGGNWAGRPVLYGMWRAWVLKDRAVRVDIDTKTRFGGIPVVEDTVDDVSDEAHAIGAQAALAVRSGESAGIAMPYGQRLRLLGVEGSIPDAIASAEYHDRQMARAFMQMFAELGNTANGSRALGDTLMDHFALGVLASADWVRKSTMVLVRRTADRNYGRDAKLPQIKFRVDDHADYTPEQIGALAEKLLITADGPLEDLLRERGNLPARSGPRPAPLADAGTPPASPDLAAAAEKPKRVPSPQERRAGHDAMALRRHNQQATADLIAAWEPVRTKQIQDLVEQVRAVRTVQDAAAITAAPVGSDVILEAMVASAEFGALTARKEAEHQGHMLPAPDLDPLRDEVLAGDAEARALILAGGLSQSARDFATAQFARTQQRPLRAAAGDGEVYTDDLAQAVLEHLSGLSGQLIASKLGGAVHGAVNQGRFKQMESWGDRAHPYASELAEFDEGKPDPDCCGPCALVDGTEYPSLAEARRDYPLGGFIGCEGGERCRGTVVVVADEEEGQA